MLEAESVAKLIQSGVDLVKSNVEGVVTEWETPWSSVSPNGGEWSEQTGAELDEQDADPGARPGEAIAPRAAEAFHQAFGTQFGQIVRHTRSLALAQK